MRPASLREHGRRIATIPAELFAREYLGSEDLAHDDKRAWLRLTPTKITSWDFRTIGMATDR